MGVPTPLFRSLITREKQKGFSLLEMAIVLAIVGLLLAGLLPTLTGQIEQQRRNDTRKQMDDIRDALTGYAIINNRLPCPALATAVTGTANAGIADCSLNSGVLPWVTLGVNETDAWGRRYTYAASSTFTTANFTLTSTGNLIVKTATTGTNLASNLPAIFISHATNGFGAYTPQGIQIAAGSDADETENSNANTIFVTHDLSPTFDDLVIWVSPNILFNRMVEAGKLP